MAVQKMYRKMLIDGVPPDGAVQEPATQCRSSVANTGRVASRTCLLPTGQAVDAGMIESIAEILNAASSLPVKSKMR